MAYRKAPPFDFDWADFYYSNLAGCFPACIAMALCYWKKQIPEIYLPLNREKWEGFINRVNSSMRGATFKLIIRMINDMYKEGRESSESLSEFLEEQDETNEDIQILNFKRERFNFEPLKLEKLSECNYWLSRKPAIPIMIRYDRRYIDQRIEGIPHAVLVSKVDTIEKKIHVIDPILRERREPMYYDLNEVESCWELTGEHKAIAIYPDRVRVKDLLTHAQTSLETFIKK